MSFSSERRVRNSLRASAATSPLATSARRSSRPASRSSDCSRSTVPRILSISRFFSNGLKSIPRISSEIPTRVRATSHFARTYERFFAFGDFFFGQFLIVELHDFFDRPRALAQILANRDQLFNHDRRPRDRLHYHQLPALDALGNRDFAFARQQRHRSHFTQIHAHGIVRLFHRTRSQIQVAAAFVRVAVVLSRPVAIGLFDRQLHRARRFRRRLILVNLDTVPLERRQQIINLFRGMYFGGQRIVYLVIKQIAALFADRNQRAYCFVFFFKTLRHKLLPQSASVVPKAFASALQALRRASGDIVIATAERSTQPVASNRSIQLCPQSGPTI